MFRCAILWVHLRWHFLCTESILTMWQVQNTKTTTRRSQKSSPKKVNTHFFRHIFLYFLCRPAILLVHLKWRFLCTESILTMWLVENTKQTTRKAQKTSPKTFTKSVLCGTFLNFFLFRSAILMVHLRWRFLCAESILAMWQVQNTKTTTRRSQKSSPKKVNTHFFCSVF